MRRMPTGTGAVLAIGFTAVSVHGYVQSFLRRIAEELPHVDLVLREQVTAEQEPCHSFPSSSLGVTSRQTRGLQRSAWRK